MRTLAYSCWEGQWAVDIPLSCICLARTIVSGLPLPLGTQKYFQHTSVGHSLLQLNVKWYGYELLRKPLIWFGPCCDKSASMGFSFFNILHCHSLRPYEGIAGLSKYLPKFDNKKSYVHRPGSYVCVFVSIRVYTCAYIYLDNFLSSQNSLQETKNIVKGYYNLCSAKNIICFALNLNRIRVWACEKGRAPWDCCSPNGNKS